MRRFLQLSGLVAALFIAIFFKMVSNALSDNGISWDYPQYSVAASQNKGVYVCRVHAVPDTFLWNGTTVSFREIWIERQVHTDYPFVWLGRITPNGTDVLCFTINATSHIFANSSTPFFRCDEGAFGGGVGAITHWHEVVIDELFHAELKEGAWGRHGAGLSLVRDWDDPHPVSVRLGW